jgi:hypothetical protein
MQVRLTKLTTATPPPTSTDGSLTGDIIRVPRHDKNGRHRKQRYTIADLPFPRGGKYTQYWRKIFVPNLLAWAGSQDDPFGANARVHLELANIWKRVFPDITLKETDMDILTYVVRRSGFH